MNNYFLQSVLKKYKTHVKMTKYLFIAMIIVLASCKQSNSNLDTKNDTIQPPAQKTTIIDEKIDYDAIWSESYSKLETEYSENFESITNTFKEVIPNGFSVISFSTGDANLDGLTDTMLIIKNNEDIYDSGTLILLLKQNDESYELALKDNYIFGGDSNTVKIDNGNIFIFEQYNAAVNISFFKFDKIKENWVFVEKFSSGLDGDGNITKEGEISILGE